MKIGISGIQGSFSEAAAHFYIQENNIDNAEILYLTDAEGVLSALEEKTVDKALFPTENSTAGVVREYLPAIENHHFNIDAKFEIPVRHALLALPGTQRSDVQQIVTQKQAWEQCQKYLKHTWPEVDFVEYIDTATAAKDLAEGKFSQDTAIIASASCAQIYNLDILDEEIQDSKTNHTTFVVASRRE